MTLIENQVVQFIDTHTTNLKACVYGDPHIVSLDGFKYTFNGLGEFILAEANDDDYQLNVQGRMVHVASVTGSPVNATVFSAIVARAGNSDTVQFQVGGVPGFPLLECLVNGNQIIFDGLPVQEFNDVTVSQQDNRLEAQFENGVYVEVRLENGFLSTLLLSLPISFMGQTTGLMGNYNGDTSDDLSPRDSQELLPLDSALIDIHERFGVTCEFICFYNANDTYSYYGKKKLSL